MSTVVRTEKRQRTIFGKLMKWIFIGFNLLMLMWFIDAATRISQMTVDSDAGRVGQAIGATLGFSVLFGVWIMGAILLGLFVLLTRGNTIVIEETPAGTHGEISRDPGMSTEDPSVVVARYIERQQLAEQTRSSSAAPNKVSFGRRH